MYVTEESLHPTLLTLRIVSPIIDLPEVDILWQPEYSMKVPVSFKLLFFLVVLLLTGWDFRLKIGNLSLRF